MSTRTRDVVSPPHITILLYGSRGDIQPGICLGIELLRRGHRVSVLAPPNLVDLARTAGVGDVHPVGLDSDDAWSSEAARRARTARNPIVRTRFALQTVRAGFDALDTDLQALFTRGAGSATADTDLLVVAPLCQDRGLALAEFLGIPMVVLRYGPMSENGIIGAIPGLTDRWSPESKRRSWRVVDRLTWTLTGWNENRFRRRLSVPAASAPLPIRLAERGVPQIQAYDPEVVPGLETEWDERKPIVGFFDLAPESRRSMPEIDSDTPDLARWLDAGQPPVFVTFGSMPVLDRPALAELWRAAAAEVGVRCLVAMGDPGGADPDDPRWFSAGAVCHASVLPRCAAVVHHGGAGTTAAGLRAGLPTLVCAVTADQPFWGARVRALGLGDSTTLSSLTRETAIAGLRTVLREEVAAAARRFAERMTPPDKAIAAAADICETTLCP